MALERDGIIGWVFEQSLFQRRVGLVNLVATTAAGEERVEVKDVPYDRALLLAQSTTPGMLEEFLTDPAGSAGAGRSQVAPVAVRRTRRQP